MPGVKISEAEFEKLLDAKVQRALNLDHGYIFAENAEAQTYAEERVERRCERELREKYDVA
jgi:hypothetical protein